MENCSFAAPTSDWSDEDWDGERQRRSEEKKEQQKRRKKKTQKEEDSVQKDNYTLSPVYNPSYKEDALPLIDFQNTNPRGRKEKKQEEEEKRLRFKLLSIRPYILFQVMKKMPQP